MQASLNSHQLNTYIDINTYDIHNDSWCFIGKKKCQAKISAVTAEAAAASNRRGIFNTCTCTETERERDGDRERTRCMCIIFNIYIYVHKVDETWIFAIENRMPTLCFTRCSTWILSTQCIDIGWMIFVYLLCSTVLYYNRLYSCCWLQCTDARGCDVFIVDLHLFVHLSTSEAQTKAKAFSSTFGFVLKSFVLRLTLVHPPCESGLCVVGWCGASSLSIWLEKRVLSTVWVCGRCGACAWLSLSLCLCAFAIAENNIFLLCKYGNRFSVCACHGLCNKQQPFTASCSFSYWDISRSPFLWVRVLSFLLCLRVFVPFSVTHTHTLTFYTSLRNFFACFSGFGESSSSLIGLTYTTLHCVAAAVTAASAGAHSFMHRYIICFTVTGLFFSCVLLLYSVFPLCKLQHGNVMTLWICVPEQSFAHDSTIPQYAPQNIRSTLMLRWDKWISIFYHEVGVAVRVGCASYAVWVCNLKYQCHSPC